MRFAEELVVLFAKAMQVIAIQAEMGTILNTCIAEGVYPTLAQHDYIMEQLAYITKVTEEITKEYYMLVNEMEEANKRN